MSRARVLVAGASGFLGRRAVPVLARQADVWAVVRTAGTQPPGAEAVVADLAPGWTARLPEAGTVVWLAQSRRYREFPGGAADMFRVNEAAFFELLEWARTRGVDRVVYASSGSVYAPGSGPWREESPTAATTMYTATKLNAERLLAQYAGCFACVTARVFSVYGPGQQGMALASVAGAAYAGRPVTLTEGTGMRCTPVFVDDAAAIFAALAQMALPANPLVVNVAGPEVVTLADVARIAASLTGREPVIERGAGQAPAVIADTTRLRGMFPDLVFHDLAAGLAATLAGGPPPTPVGANLPE